MEAMTTTERPIVATLFGGPLDGAFRLIPDELLNRPYLAFPALVPISALASEDPDATVPVVRYKAVGHAAGWVTAEWWLSNGLPAEGLAARLTRDARVKIIWLRMVPW